MDIQDLDADPFAALRDWLSEAERAVPRADAMTLATAAAGGHPSARVVLLRGLDERGLLFFTNRTSRKGRELLENPSAALVFHWPELGRQVRVEGTVEDAGRETSETYWETRPRGSRIAAWVSPQSEPLQGREELDARYAEVEARFGDGPVPLPDFWGGYLVVPKTFEFWSHRENRLHDRIRYTRTPSGWSRDRLAP
ncbi:MAG: pyridoxamine 5'-phosphate oxidase [Gaiellaceae bacterium]